MSGTDNFQTTLRQFELIIFITRREQLQTKSTTRVIHDDVRLLRYRMDVCKHTITRVHVLKYSTGGVSFLPPTPFHCVHFYIFPKTSLLLLDKTYRYFSLPVRIVTRVSPNGPEYFMYRRHGAKINGVFRDIANNRAALKPKHDRKISPRTKFF